MERKTVMENHQIEEPEDFDFWETHDEDGAFYAEALPCEGCGKPVKTRQYNEEHEIWIGNECGCQAPEQPMCPELDELLAACEFVGELSEVMQTHRRTCAVCGSIKKPLKTERGATVEDERRSA